MRSGQSQLFAYLLVGAIAVCCALYAARLLRTRSPRPSVDNWLPPASGYSSTGEAKVNPVRPCYERGSTGDQQPGHDGRHAVPSAAEPQEPSNERWMPAVIVPAAAPNATADAARTPRPAGRLYPDRFSANSSAPHDPWQALYSSMAARGQTRPNDEQPRRGQVTPKDPAG